MGAKMTKGGWYYVNLVKLKLLSPNPLTYMVGKNRNLCKNWKIEVKQFLINCG